MINIKQIENIQKIIGDREQARAIADLLKGKVEAVYNAYLNQESFQEFIDSRSDFIQYNKDGTTKLIEIDGETENEMKQLAQLQAYFLEMEM
jgi:uncharacterized 2Fe-2S/4Fe-4S cluster protein (DUF4445 family)